MKSVIQLSIIFATLLGVFAGLFLYFNYAENKEVSTFALALFAICGLGVALLFKADKRQESSEAAKLNLAVSDQVKQILTSKQPYQLYASSISLFRGVLVLLLAAFMVIFGLAVRPNLYISILVVVFGTLILWLLIMQIKKLFQSPIVYIDKNGINHYIRGEIPWNDVTGIFLSTLEQKGVKQFILRIDVIDIQKYILRMGIIGRYVNNSTKNRSLSLLLPTTEVNAKVVEAVSKAYAKIAGAPTLDTKVERLNQIFSEVEKLNKLLTTPENEEKLLRLLEQSSALSQEISSITSQRVKEVSEAIKKMKIISALGIVFFIIYLWLKLSK